MPTVPGSLIFSIRAGLMDENGEPCDGWLCYFYVAGTTTPKDTFSDSDLDPSHVNTNPVELDSAGRAVVYLEPGGYKIVVHDENDVLVFSQDEFEDIGQTLFADLGVTQTLGADTSHTSGYTVLDTDNLVEISSTGGADPCVVNLQPCADRGFPLYVKNLGDIALELRANGSDTIDTAATYAVAASTATILSTVGLLSDGISSWKVISYFKP